jgi:hypothetical protein
MVIIKRSVILISIYVKLIKQNENAEMFCKFHHTKWKCGTTYVIVIMQK